MAVGSRDAVVRFVILLESNSYGYIAEVKTRAYPRLQWAGQENADFRATDSGSLVSSVVLRIVGQSVARAALGD